jgi:hypothetical protein
MRFGLSLAASGVVVVLVACGGGGGTGASAAEFRRQADAICKKYEQKLDALGTPTSVDDLAEFVDAAVPIIEAGNKELADLTPPEEFASEWARVMELQEKNLQTTRELHDAIHESDEAKAQDLMGQLGSTGEESNRLATEMGLQQCGRNNA